MVSLPFLMIFSKPAYYLNDYNKNEAPFGFNHTISTDAKQPQRLDTLYLGSNLGTLHNLASPILVSNKDLSPKCFLLVPKSPPTFS